MLERVYIATCDRCGATKRMFTKTKKEAIKMIDSSSWRRVKQFTYCEHHCMAMDDKKWR